MTSTKDSNAASFHDFFPMPSRPSIRLTERDHDVLDALADYRFLSAPQAAALFFPSTPSAGRRLRELAQAGLAVTVFMPVRPWDRTTRTLYALSGRGARHLAPRHHGITPKHLTTREQRSGLFLAHTLARNDVRIVLENLTRLRPDFSLLAWHQAPEDVHSSAVIRVGVRAVARVPAVPDGVALCRVAGECQVLAIEIDMGTVPLTRMARRYRAYWKAWRGGTPRIRYGPVPYRVLTVANSDKRAETLRKTAARAPEHGRPGSRLFWFATLDDFNIEDPKRLLTARFTVAHPQEPEGQALFPRPDVKPDSSLTT